MDEQEAGLGRRQRTSGAEVLRHREKHRCPPFGAGFLFGYCSSAHMPAMLRSKFALAPMPRSWASIRLPASDAPAAQAVLARVRSVAMVVRHFLRSAFFATGPWPGITVSKSSCRALSIVWSHSTMLPFAL